MAKRSKDRVLSSDKEVRLPAILSQFVLSFVQRSKSGATGKLTLLTYDLALYRDGTVSLSPVFAADIDPDEVGSKDVSILQAICAEQNAAFLQEAKAQVKEVQKRIRIYSATPYLSKLLTAYQQAVDVYLAWFDSATLVPAPPPRNLDGVLKSVLIKALVHAERQKNPDLTYEKIFYKLEEQRGDSSGAIKGAYYYKPKKAAKKVRKKVS